MLQGVLNTGGMLSPTLCTTAAPSVLAGQSFGVLLQNSLTREITHLHAGPSLAFVGSTPSDLRENTARATPNIELGKDAAKAVDRNKPALPSPGQIQGKVKDASRKIKSEVRPVEWWLDGVCVGQQANELC